MLLRSAILPALAGYLFTFYNAKKTDERKAQIERCNDQVRLLYGPLLACVTATRAGFAAMVGQHSCAAKFVDIYSDGTYETFIKAVREHPEGPEAVSYRHWMRSVLQPLNEKAAEVIVNHVNLLESEYIDALLLQFVAHVSANRVILKRWEEGAVEEWSAVSYPDKLPDYVEREFKRVKMRQAKLLGISSASNEIGLKAKQARTALNNTANKLDGGKHVVLLPKTAKL